MNTHNPLPFSNQFERGHSFNWAGEWKENTHYFNNQYVTDFISLDGMLLACRKDHLSEKPLKPEPILQNGEIVGTSSPYWIFIAAINSRLYVPEFDEENNSIIFKLKQNKDLPNEIVTPIRVRISEEQIELIRQLCNQDAEILIDSRIEDNLGDKTDVAPSQRIVTDSLEELDNKIDEVSSKAIEHVQLDGTELEINDKTVNLPAYPTTLPASDVHTWAKSETKPSYTLKEIQNAEDVNAIEDIQDSNGLLKKTSNDTWELDKNTYITATDYSEVDYDGRNFYTKNEIDAKLEALRQLIHN